MGEWTVVHKTHTNTVLSTFKPSNIHIELNYNDVHDVTYEIAFSDPNLTRDCFAPLRTDWYLYRDTRCIQGGLHTGRNLKAERDSVIVAGKSFLHYYERLNWAWDIINLITKALVAGTWPKAWVGVQTTQIAREILDYCMGPALASGAANGLNVTYSLASAGTGKYLLDQTNSETALEHVQLLCDMRGSEFDFFLTPVDKVFRMIARAIPPTTSPWSFTDATTIADWEWDDSGPDGTYVVGGGSGSGLQSLSVAPVYQPSVDVYRWLYLQTDLGEIKAKTQLDALAAAEGQRARNPQKKINLTIRPDNIPAIWGSGTGWDYPEKLLGQAVYFHYDTGYHDINANFKVIQITIDVDNDGNETMELGMEMVYAET